MPAPTPPPPGAPPWSLPPHGPGQSPAPGPQSAPSAREHQSPAAVHHPYGHSFPHSFQGHIAPPPPASRRASWLTAAWGVGVAAIVGSTFLPWLYSGRVAKNSYQLTGVTRRRLDLSPGLDIALAAWPFVGPVWAVVAVLFLLGVRRTAVLISMVLAALVTTVAVFAVIAESRLTGGLISAAYAGPVCAGIGALVVLISSASLLLVWRDRASVVPNR